MIFYSNKEIRISTFIEESNYDEVYERKLATDNGIPIRKNGRYTDVDSIKIRKDFIPDIFVIEKYIIDNNECEYVIKLTNDIIIASNNQDTIRFWFKIFNTDDFESKTIEQIKKEYAEEFI